MRLVLIAWGVWPLLLMAGHDTPRLLTPPDHQQHMSEVEITTFMAMQEPPHPHDSKAHKCNRKTATKCECCKQIDPETDVVYEDSKCKEYCHRSHCHCGPCDP